MAPIVIGFIDAMAQSSTIRSALSINRLRDANKVKAGEFTRALLEAKETGTEGWTPAMFFMDEGEREEELKKI